MFKIWGKYFSDKKFVKEFFVSIILFAFVLFFLAIFLKGIETRNGVALNDPMLTLFNPVDVTWITFIIIYGSLIAGIFYLIKSPQKIILAIQFYTVLVLTRITAMYLLPLEPPVTMIPLSDPFAEYFTTGSVMTKDLFFSGHTATLFFLYLMTEKKLLRYVFLCATITVALLVMAQHVHYAIDVFAAPFFTYAVYNSVLLLRIKINLNHD